MKTWSVTHRLLVRPGTPSAPKRTEYTCAQESDKRDTLNVIMITKYFIFLEGIVSL